MQLFRRGRRYSTPVTSTTPSDISSPTISNGTQSQDQTLASLTRTISEETLISSHQVSVTNTTHYDRPELFHQVTASSDITTVSRADTIVELILGHSFSEFNEIRTTPVVSFFFQKGLFVFPSEESLNLYKNQKRSVEGNQRNNGLAMPILQAVSPIFSAFKKNSPILTIYKFKKPDPNGSVQSETEADWPKFEYCKVYIKYLKEKITKYTLVFTPNGLQNDSSNHKIVMFNSSNETFTDVIFRNTRMRWLGTTSITCAYGSGFFKLLVLDTDSPSLCDGVELDRDDCVPNLAHSLPTESVNSNSINQLIARFSDKNSQTYAKKRMVKHGDIKVIEVFNAFDRNDVFHIPDCSLVLISMALVLRDQETKKKYGNVRCYDSSTHSNVLYL